MVEHRIRDPQVVDILESEVQPLAPMARGGLCLICGAWVDAHVADVYDVAIGRGGSIEVEGVCHVGCLAGVIHPSASLP